MCISFMFKCVLQCFRLFVACYFSLFLGFLGSTLGKNVLTSHFLTLLVISISVFFCFVNDLLGHL